MRLDPAPFDGQGLNPVLQDPALAFHPPFLYTGYVGFSMAFSFAVAALIDGRIDAAWARWVRPWTLAAWMCLTLGIAMGSWWAYYELGWGGFWFWDPVENASFMPWLAGTALLHSALVMEKRDALKVWTILLAIITFSLSLMGTFLVRSGVLTSVHAFAVDPARGIFILAIMGVFIGGALALFAWRAPLLSQGGLFAPISREGALVLNNLLLTTACAAVFVGTLYPLALDALTGDKISVGAPFFNLTFAPLIVPLLIAVPFGPLLAWKRGDLLAAAQRLMAAACVGARGHRLSSLAFEQKGPWLAPFGIGLGIWLIAGALSELAYRVKLFEAGWSEAWRALAQPAALGLWHGARSCRARARGDRHRRDHRLAVRGDPGDEAGRDSRDRRLHARLQGRRAASGSELPRAGRSVRRHAQRQGGDRARARPSASSTVRAERHHRSRHPRELARRSLCGARRSAERRRLQRPPLFQSAGAAHLARRAGHVLRRRGLAVGSPLAGRRAEARAGESGRGSRRQNSDGRPPRSLGASPALAALHLSSRRPAKAVQPDEVLPDPALEARARAISEGLRCLVCQNQSIDDFGSPSRQGFAALGARAARRPATAISRSSTSSSRAMANSCCSSRASSRIPCCSGSPRRRCSSRRFCSSLRPIGAGNQPKNKWPRSAVNEERRLKKLLDEN